MTDRVVSRRMADRSLANRVVSMVVSMVVVVVAVVVLMVVVVGEEICFALTRDKLLGSNRWIVELTLK